MDRDWEAELNKIRLEIEMIQAENKGLRDQVIGIRRNNKHLEMEVQALEERNKRLKESIEASEQEIREMQSKSEKPRLSPIPGGESDKGEGGDDRAISPPPPQPDDSGGKSPSKDKGKKRKERGSQSDGKQMPEEGITKERPSGAATAARASELPADFPLDSFSAFAYGQDTSGKTPSKGKGKKSKEPGSLPQPVAVGKKSAEERNDKERSSGAATDVRAPELLPDDVSFSSYAVDASVVDTSGKSPSKGKGKKGKEPGSLAQSEAGGRKSAEERITRERASGEATALGKPELPADDVSLSYSAVAYKQRMIPK